MTPLRCLSTRELMLAVAGGIASAALGQVLGRMVHLALPLPMSGSVVVALPRAVVLLVVLARIDRLGALTVAGLAEAAAKFGLGLGGMPGLSLLAPVLAGLAGDLTWSVLRPVLGTRMRLILSGAALSGARVLAALVFLALVRVPLQTGFQRAGWLLWSIIAVNVVLGMAAGLVAAGIVGELRRAGVME